MYVYTKRDATHKLEVVGVGLLDDFDEPHDARHLSFRAEGE